MPQLSRRSVLLASGATLLGAGAALTGCSVPGSGGGDRSRTLALSNRNSSTVRNFNVYSPASAIGSLANFVYEPPLWIVEMSGGRAEPWLMKSFRWLEGGHTLELTVRDGVRFADGKLLTVDDALFSFQLPLRLPETNIAGVTYTTAERSGPDSVRLSWDHPAYQELNPLGNLKIVPKHLWEHQKPTTWANPDPVGTGPCTVESFSSAQVRMKVRDDYWGGAIHPEYVSFRTVTEDNAKLRMLTHELDFVDISWVGGTKYFDTRDPGTNAYVPSPNGTVTALYFNHARKPWDDVHVRRALNLALDRTAISDLLDDGQDAANAAGLAPTVYGDLVLPEYAHVPKPDARAAHTELAKGGWKVSGGRLVHRDGRSFAVKLATFAGIPSNSIQSAVIADQWRRNLGVDVVQSAVNVPTLVDRVNKGDFDIHLSPQGGGSVYNHYHVLMDSGTAVPVGKVTTANFIRWKDQETGRLLAALRSTEDPGTVRSTAAGLQHILVDQVPLIPVIWSCNWAARASTYWTNWPTNKNATSVLGLNSSPAAARMLRSLKAVAA